MEAWAPARCYVFQGGKDATAVKSLLGAVGNDLGRFRSMVLDRYLADTDRFCVKNGHNLGTLWIRVNNYTESTRRGAAAARDSRVVVDPYPQRSRLWIRVNNYTSLAAGRSAAKDSVIVDPYPQRSEVVAVLGLGDQCWHESTFRPASRWWIATCADTDRFCVKRRPQPRNAVDKGQQLHGVPRRGAAAATPTGPKKVGPSTPLRTKHERNPNTTARP